MQEIIVAVIVLIAVIYLIFRVKKLVKGEDSSCGCGKSSKGGCQSACNSCHTDKDNKEN